MVDEAVSRRPGFRDGTKIRLADGQMWTMPAPPRPSEWKIDPFGVDYTPLVRAIKQADSQREQRFAELAFAIFLLGHNYCLLPADYERLLGFPPDSPDLVEWQISFRRVSEEHIRAILDDSPLRVDDGLMQHRRRRFSRLLAWLRGHVLFRWWSIDSRIS